MCRTVFGIVWQDVKIEQMRQDRERAREEAAREKARERERRLEARNAAILSSAEQLERKIQLKVQPFMCSLTSFSHSLLSSHFHSAR